MLRRLQSFCTLTARERIHFSLAVGMLPLTAIGLRLFGFQRWFAWINRLATPVPSTADSTTLAATIRQTVRCLQWAVRYGLYGGNCLSRSLTLWWLLHRQGIVSDLRIGVRNSSGHFEAHAWVEYQGYPLNEQAQVHQRYTGFAQAITPKDANNIQPMMDESS